MVNDSVSPSGSTPVIVIIFGVSSVTSTAWLSAVGSLTSFVNSHVMSSVGSI